VTYHSHTGAPGGAGKGTMAPWEFSTSYTLIYPSAILQANSGLSTLFETLQLVVVAAYSILENNFDNS